jgi:phage-related protein
MTVPYTDLQERHRTSGLVELFTLDATALGGSIFRFTNTPNPDGTGLVFGGNTYNPVPVHAEGWDMASTGTPPKPKLTVSDVNYMFLAAVVSLGDLVGAKLTRVRTFGKYLDAATFTRWNTLNYSEDFTQSYWTKTRSTISANAVTAPIGGTLADKLVEDATASNSHFIQVASTHLPVVSGNQYTLSFYAKAGERTFLSVEAGTSALFTTLQRRDMLLSTGGNSTFNSGTSTCTSTDVGDGWFRYVITLPAATASGNNVVSFLLKNADVSTRSYSGDGTSGAYVWGVQWQVGASASKYQFTQGTHQPFADSSKYVGPETYVVEQKVGHVPGKFIQWQLTSPLDRFGMLLPRRQVLKDMGFPGVARTRVIG